MMFTLTTLINDNKLPCFIRKKPILLKNEALSNTTVLNTSGNLNNKTNATAASEAEKRQEYEKSLFDSLDLLNEEYLETYGIEENINSSRTDKSTSTAANSSSSSASAATSVFETSTSTTKVSSDNDIVYLCKILTLNCAFARRYESKNVENYLNSKYGASCNASIDLSNENIIYNSVYDLTNIKYDDYIIPSNYEGLLEVLPDYSKQVHDTLDHECDVISFASRLKQPHNYYIAKPLQLFEIVSSTCQQKSAPTQFDEIEDNYDDLIRKWVTFEVGTIILATKVLMVVFPPEQKHEKTLYEKVKKNVFCNCASKNKIKFEVAIEFKIVKRFDELISTMHNDRKKSMHISNADMQQIRTENCNYTTEGDQEEKYFYLPIYHDPNDSIDLIPIAPTNSLQLNSLQNIFNLIQHNHEEAGVLEHPIRVRIRVENSFNKLHNISNITTQSFTHEPSSFYEIYARKTAKFLIGYNVKREKFVLYALDDEHKYPTFSYELIEQKVVETIHEKEYLSKVINVKLNSYLNDFINNFQYNIHRIEFDHVMPPTSSHNITDDDGYVSCRNSKIKNQLVMHWRKKNQYTTMPNPRPKLIKTKKVHINGHTNEAFNEVAENDEETKNDASNSQQQLQRSRSKSLPEADVLKASFTNMSSIIEQDQDEIKKTKV